MLSSLRSRRQFNLLRAARARYNRTTSRIILMSSAAVGAGQPGLPLDLFHPAVSGWFRDCIGTPTEVQCRGWDAIRQGRHTLIAAPTGSGKTLAAFLTALDDLLVESLRQALPDQVRVLYVSPLKALGSDIHANLIEPRAAIARRLAALGQPAPEISAAVRTGDTTAAARAAILRRPPHVLITTPESLYLMLTSPRSRDCLRHVRTVIIDEIHAVIGTRRGSHLALSLERLAALTERRFQRIGLSATQRPVDDVARFLVGADSVDTAGLADCVVIDQGHRRAMDVAIELPQSPLEAVMSHEVWTEYYDRLSALVSGHRTTLVFVNTRKMAERLARCLSDRLGDDLVAAHHGSLSKERRLDAEHGLKRGELKVVVATASLELGIDIGHVDLVCQIGSPRRIATFLQRVGRAGHTIGGTPKGRLFPETRDDLVECAALLAAVERGELDRLVAFDAPLDVLAQQIVAETACRDWSEADLFALVRRAWPYRSLQRADFDAVVAMLAEGFTTRRGRRGALLYRDEVNQRLRARRHAGLTALTAGGAIPDTADYRVVLEPDDLFIGTLNEDFAIESNAGDVFQLGNSSWRILQVASGVVRVADAHGAPPSIPFWLGEAPGRSVELSEAVGRLRRDVADRLPAAGDPATAGIALEWLCATPGVTAAAAEQIVTYLQESLHVLGVLPTGTAIVLERFFDESGGMQLVLHAPFGSRVNRAWALALRKRFCRQFNFELQAAATDEGLLLSLGPQHAFPLADVFRYLHPLTVRDVLIQAFLDAPVFQTRWRWNAAVSLAVPRAGRGRQVPAALQRMQAEDLLAAAFPDAAACLENIPGDRTIPDHPLVKQTVRDCLEEAMDLPRLVSILERIHDGGIRCVARDTPEPSPLSHGLLNARPYAFMDDAPLEERRAHAVQTRRASEPSRAGALGALDQEAIDAVTQQAWPDPRDADELHDALMTAGVLTSGEVAADAQWSLWMRGLAESSRATCIAAPSLPAAIWCAAERLPEVAAAVGTFEMAPVIAAPPARAARQFTADQADVELVRSRLGLAGPAPAARLGEPLGFDTARARAALIALESEGVAMRGSFTPGAADEEWCDRRLLARIHRRTLTRLRAEIEPITPAQYMRFVSAWQHAAAETRLVGVDGLRAVLAQLDGFGLAASAWEAQVLPLRVHDYDPAMLDVLCFSGEVSWARLTASSPRPSPFPGADAPRPVRATPVCVFAREHAPIWRTLAGGTGRSGIELSPRATAIDDVLAARGASFVHEMAATSGLSHDEVLAALGELVTAGLVASDGFGGLRAMLAPRGRPAWSAGAFRSRSREAGAPGGRWAKVVAATGEVVTRDEAIEQYARTLLSRYGIVFRRLLVREPYAVPWRELLRVFRQLEARGEVRGGRFVGGMSGEHFAAPEAVDLARELRRAGRSGDTLTVCGADPLNLAGIVVGDQRVPALHTASVTFRDGAIVDSAIDARPTGDAVVAG